MSILLSIWIRCYTVIVCVVFGSKEGFGDNYMGILVGVTF
jgi:hypothetical protein